jgi:drug/metabolite transporter (DMT)-like permease
MALGIILGLTSAFFSALSAILQKKVLKEIDTILFSLLLNIFVSIYSIIIFITNPKFSTDVYFNILLILKSLLLSIAFYYVMTSIKKLNLSEALPILALSPIVLAIVAAIILNDYLSIEQSIGLFSIVLGIYLIELPNTETNLFEPFIKITSTKYNTAFIALGIFIITSIIDKYLIGKHNFPINQVILYQHIIGAIFFGIIFILRKQNFAPITKGYNLLFLIFLISLFTISYRIFEFMSIKLLPVAVSISLKRISVLIAVIIGGKLFNEEHLKYRIPATLLIFIGIVLFNIN